MEAWVGKIFRALFLFIDTIVYWAIDMVYRLFIMISETGIFTPESIREFGNRIYVLLGVFMLFKVSFSLITYILNPDDMMDKNKGMGKLVTNFFVVLIGIVAVPYVFQAAYSLQAIILKENVIGSIIMGENAQLRENSEYQDESDYIKQGGKLMSYTTLSAFIRLNPNVVGEECANEPVGKNQDTGEIILNPSCDDNIDLASIKGNNDVSVEQILIDAKTKNDASYYTNTGIINLRAKSIDNGNDWLFDYTYIISSIAGGLIAWILLIFCIDIATRSVKLGFLQLIAPIPIISCIDPKSGKDGVFQKWLKECGKTYLDLFIRLISIYFALYVITIIANGKIYNITTNEPQKNIFVIVLIIFGALMFAKQLPDLISNILGVKLSGGFTLNPMKKLGQSPYAAGAMGLVGGAIGGMAANTWALGSRIKKDGFKNAMTDGQTGFKGFRRAVGNTFTGLAGAGSAGVRGMKSGFSSGGKGSLFDGAAKGIKASSQARNLRDKGYGAVDKIKDRATDLAGVKFSTGTTSQLKNEVNTLQQKLANARRNEQNAGAALQHLMAQQGDKTGNLIKTFDGAYRQDADGNAILDAKGNLQYCEKTYDSYKEVVARQHATTNGADWDSLDATARQQIINHVESQGMLVDEAIFNSLNASYEARNSADNEGRALEKKINDIQEDMGKFKDRNKGS